jgi:hypothetical protein
MRDKSQAKERGLQHPVFSVVSSRDIIEGTLQRIPSDRKKCSGVLLDFALAFGILTIS